MDKNHFVTHVINSLVNPRSSETELLLKAGCGSSKDVESDVMETDELMCSINLHPCSWGNFVPQDTFTFDSTAPITPQNTKN